MSLKDTAIATAAVDVPLNDLGPLAWVLEELRKAVSASTRAVRRFSQEAVGLPVAEIGSLDTSQLRVARQQLHQAVGATDMVGQAASATLLRAMESAVQQCVLKPEQCTDDAANRIERAGFGLLQYLDSVLNGKASSAVALFPQYRDVQALSGNDRAHPADLWPVAWVWRDPVLRLPDKPLSYDIQTRARFEQAVLRTIKTQDRAAARQLRDLTLGFAAAQGSIQPRVFWKLCAAFFEAQSLGLCPADIHVKRATSRVLQQFSALIRGELGVPDRLAQDLAFFCAQARPAEGMVSPTLTALRQSLGMAGWVPVDYENSPFGRYDPAVLAQARKRIGAVKEAWSSVAGNELARLRGLGDQFSLVSDSLVKLHPPSGALAQTLMQAAEATVRSGVAPSPTLAMEVATAVMFLEAAFEELDPGDQQLASRTARLAQRLERVQAGGQPEPLEPWIEELYHRVSDRQTMGSVVGELRGALDELERMLDQYFRHPQESALLASVPGQLAQMRGVLSVLGLDHAVRAVAHMRETVTRLADTAASQTVADTGGTFNNLGNNLGALGLLFDMLSYQPVMAKKLFVFNESQGELQPLMGRMGADGLLQAQLPEQLATVGVLNPPPERRTTERRPAADQAASADEPNALHQFLPTNFAISEGYGLAPPSEFLSTTLAGPDSVLPLPARPAHADNLLDLPAALLGDNARDAAPVLPPVVISHDASSQESDLAEDDLLSIFLEEAREVVETGTAAIQALGDEPSNLENQTTLRRAFHTLKGSSRMVGLNDFGEAAWSMEQLLNAWLADRRAATPDLRSLATQALAGLGRWAIDIAQGSEQGWTSRPFQIAADAMRLENRLVPLEVSVAPVVQDGLDAAAVAPDVGLESSEDLTPDQVALEFPELSGADLAVVEPISAEIEDIDFDSLVALTALPADPMPEAAEPLLVGVLAEKPEPEPEPVAVTDLSVDFDLDPSEEQTRVIGDLRIGIPLYNVYLNEADEWSRRLQTELSEWAIELHRPLADSTVGLAHALAGSSSTVGFAALSSLGRALEHALQLAQLQGPGTPGQAQAFSAAAEDIRRLLHQFAAGFLKEPDPDVVAALQELLADSPVEPVISAPPLTAPVPVADLVPAAVEPSPAMAWAQRARELDDGLDEERDIDAQDALDEDLFVIFEEEAQDLLPQLGGALRQWAARPDNAGARAEALRVLHTLKGSARLAGAMRLGERAHHMEAAIEHLDTEDDADGVKHAQQVDSLLTRLDALQTGFDSLRVGYAKAEQSQAQEPAILAASVEAIEPVAAPQGDATPASSDLPPLVVVASPMLLPVQPPRAAPVVQRSGGQVVRIRSQMLDRLVNQTGEVMMTRARLEAGVGQFRSSLSDLTDNLDRLRQQLREIELQAELQMQSRMALTKDAERAFDPLEFDRFTRVQELTRMMAESVNDVAT
ncbi:MAG: hypothetical protein RLZZ401_2270, partial [Pseudomonadota bacterium]